MKTVYSIDTGAETIAHKNPARPSTYLIPAGTTHEKPPVFNPQTHTCQFKSGSWVLSEIVVKDEIKEMQKAEVIPAMEQLRMERDSRLGRCDWRMTEDYPYTDKEEWKSYRVLLREIPNQVEAGVYSVSLDEKGDLIFNNWPVPPAGA